MHGTPDHAAEMAAQQRVGALSLLADGDVHAVIPEPPGDSTEALAVAVVAEIATRLTAVG